jgi:peptidoglycan-associated lipoprotein
LNDVLFDLDVYQVVSEPEILQANAQWLKDHPDVQVNLAGYADPRGDIVYNLALSQRRANTVKQKLMEMGVRKDRIAFDPGWGKLYQTCLDPTENCWKRNRRVHFEYANPFADQRAGGPSR